MIKNYFKMKAAEIRLKLAFYSMIEGVIEEKDDIINLAGNLYNSFKDIPVNELQDKVITTIVGMIYSDNQENKTE